MVSIHREIAHVRQRDNWLASALERLQDGINGLEHAKVKDPPPPDPPSIDVDIKARAPRPMIEAVDFLGHTLPTYKLQLGHSGLPKIDMHDPAHDNLLLQNVVDVRGTVVGPTTALTTYSALVEAKIVTRGNLVLILWLVSFSNSQYTADAFFQIYRDAVAIGPRAEGSGPTGGQNVSLSGVWFDNPVAGLHTYDLEWASSVGTNTVTADGTNYEIAVVELG